MEKIGTASNVKELTIAFFTGTTSLKFLHLFVFGDSSFTVVNATMIFLCGFNRLLEITEKFSVARSVLHMMSTLENFEESDLECYCELPAKLRISQTPKNPFRLFYNCPKEISQQCGFFRWSDEPEPTGDRHIHELNLIRSECIHLQERLTEVQQEHDNERANWEREKSELTSQLLVLRAQLDDVQNRIKMANESCLMPPLDTLSIRDNEDDNALVICTL